MNFSDQGDGRTRYLVGMSEENFELCKGFQMDCCFDLGNVHHVSSRRNQGMIWFYGNGKVKFDDERDAVKHRDKLVHDFGLPEDVMKVVPRKESD